MTKYLTQEDIIRIDRYVIEHSQHQLIYGIHSRKNIELIVAQIGLAVFGKELHEGLPMKAAYLMQALCKHHCFIDGNKRTAFLATRLFLDLNGYDLELNDHQLVNLVVDIAKADDSAENTLKIGEFIERHYTKKS